MSFPSSIFAFALFLGINVASFAAVNKGVPPMKISHRTEQPLLWAQKPYEDFGFSYVNVIRDGKQWHLWYTCYDHNYKDDNDGYLGYASSTDGVHWQRPSLGLVEYHGSKANNLLLSGPTIKGFHGQMIFLDDRAPAPERYKMVYSRMVAGQWQVFGAVSPDGLHWKLLEKPLLAQNSDTQTVCFRDGDLYRLYVRMWSGGDFKGKRIVGYTESRTFGDFPAPRAILSPAAQDPEELQFYNSAATKLADGSYVMFPSAFYVKADMVIPHLAVSSDGVTFNRPDHEPFMALGKGFDRATIYVAPGAIPADKPGQYWIYYLGTKTKHDENLPGKVHYDGGVGRFLLTVPFKE